MLGATGMLGTDLVDRLAARLGTDAQVRMLALGRRELDITNPSLVRRTITDFAPQVVFNCAAYTNVDGCETDAERAMAVNAHAPGFVAEACRNVQALLVQYSTDFVFDGAKQFPYCVNDPPRPLSVYGRSKLLGEEVVRGSGCAYLLIRTSWLFGTHGPNFVETILRKAESGENLRVVDDQIGRPTFTVDLVEGTLRLLESDAAGTYHFANNGQCSWHGFAEEICLQEGRNCRVTPIRSEELNRPAKRPRYSVLDLGDYVGRTGHEPPLWQDALARYLERRRLQQKAADPAFA